MARIIGGIGASHSPTIGYAKDTNKDNDPGWKPIFTGFKVVQEWACRIRISTRLCAARTSIRSRNRVTCR